MKTNKKYVASPYTYGPFNNPTSWGIWNTETNTWMPDRPTPRKRDAELDAKLMNKNLTEVNTQ